MGNISFTNLKTTNKSTLERSVTQVKYFTYIKWKGLNEGFANSYWKPSEIVIGDEWIIQKGTVPKVNGCALQYNRNGKMDITSLQFA